MKFNLENGVITLFIIGELSSTNAASVEADMDSTMQGKSFTSVVLDLGSCTYVSSAGLRIVLKLKQKYGNVSVINASLEVYDVFEMTGFSSIMPVKKAMRTIDVSNAEVIGSGFFSTVYRLDKDTIVKVFNRTSDPEQIERELRLAKEAFVLGVPTAISFDIVRVGDKLGVCFEMLDCMSLKNAVVAHPENIHDYVVKYTALLKTINTTECYDPNIPDIKKFYLEKLEVSRPMMEEKYYLKAKELLESVEDRQTFVHGDCHFKNIMVQNDELILIDMDTLSVGHPIFEFAAIYAPYCAFNEDDPGNSERFFGIKEEDSTRLYNAVVDLYFGKDDPALKDKIRIVSYVHMMWWNRVNEPSNNKRFEGCRGRLYQLLDQYNDLDIGV